MTDKHSGDNALLRESLYGTTPEPTYAGVTSFMRRKYTQDLDGVDVVVTGVPLDTATTNRPGARFGPRAIRAASTIMAWERPYGMEFDPFDKLAVVDYGDCFFDFGRSQGVLLQLMLEDSGLAHDGTGEKNSHGQSREELAPGHYASCHDHSLKCPTRCGVAACAFSSFGTAKRCAVVPTL